MVTNKIPLFQCSHPKKTWKLIQSHPPKITHTSLLVFKVLKKHSYNVTKILFFFSKDKIFHALTKIICDQVFRQLKTFLGFFKYCYFIFRQNAKTHLQTNQKWKGRFLGIKIAVLAGPNTHNLILFWQALSISIVFKSYNNCNLTILVNQKFSKNKCCAKLEVKRSILSLSFMQIFLKTHIVWF